MISISALCINGKLIKISGPGFQVYEITVCHFVVNNPAAVKQSQGHEYICFKLSFLSSLNDLTLATKQVRLYLSTCNPFNCMSCLKQPTTICADEIRETSWAATLFAVVVHSLMTSQRHTYSCTIGTITGWRDFCPRTAHPCFCRFYSTFTEVWFRSVLRSLVIWLRQSKLNVLHSALTNLRWHCRGRHFRRPTNTCILGTRVIGPTALKVHCVVHEATASRRCRHSLFITVIVVVNVT